MMDAVEDMIFNSLSKSELKVMYLISLMDYKRMIQISHNPNGNYTDPRIMWDITEYKDTAFSESGEFLTYITPNNHGVESYIRVISKLESDNNPLKRSLQLSHHCLRDESKDINELIAREINNIMGSMRH